MRETSEELARRTPPGQVLTSKWPVLTYGLTPRFDPKRWSFRVYGEVERPITLDYAACLARPRVEVTADIHCVTRWSRFDTVFEGFPVEPLLREAGVRATAHFAVIHADPDYTTNLPLEELVDDDVVLALKHDGQELPPEHGGPLRLVVPKLYFWKSAKWLRAFEFLDVNPPGFWEKGGYHNDADPWREERFG